VSQRDGLLLLGRGYDDNNNNKKSLRTYSYGLEGFLAAGSAFPLRSETMTKCMQWKDQIAYRCPLGLIPPGVMNCVCVYNMRWHAAFIPLYGFRTNFNFVLSVQYSEIF
jgi:hypothetical protein